MAHKTLIGGTAYEIGGGRTLVNGTGYSIDKGKTLVGGTVYEVGFSQPVKLIITGYADKDYAYVMIDGVRHYEPSIVEITPNSEVTVYVKTKQFGSTPSSSGSNPLYITMNGADVARTSDQTQTLSYTIPVGGEMFLNINFGYKTQYSSGKYNLIHHCSITSVEVPEGYAVIGYAKGGSDCSIIIDGVYCTEAAYVVPIGTVIYCTATSFSGANSTYTGIIVVNGTTVATANKYEENIMEEYWVAEYNYTVKCDASITAGSYDTTHSFTTPVNITEL